MITACSIKAAGLRIQILLFALPLSDRRKPERMTFFQWQYLHSTCNLNTETSLSLKGNASFQLYETSSKLNPIVRVPISLFKMSYHFASYCSLILNSSQYLLPKRFHYSLLPFLRCYLFVPTPVLLPLGTA